MNTIFARDIEYFCPWHRRDWPFLKKKCSFCFLSVDNACNSGWRKCCNMHLAFVTQSDSKKEQVSNRLSMNKTFKCKPGNISTADLTIHGSSYRLCQLSMCSSKCWIQNVHMSTGQIRCKQDSLFLRNSCKVILVDHFGYLEMSQVNNAADPI